MAPTGRSWTFEVEANATGNLPEVAAGVREGDILAGKYRVSKVLGAGGMGVVVAAHHIYLDEKVAIKFLHPNVLGNSEAVARFTQEARASVKIKNEHVVRVIDVGTLDAGAPYMVMEYLDGGDLGAWVEQRGPLPVEQAVEFVLQASEALAEAHMRGIIHRDLKPSNLFCIRRSDNRYFIKVLDFGISKALGWGGSAPDMGITKTSSIIGSPLYMSPEQMQSAKSVDVRTDIWSLGIILYELLTGSAPFYGDTLTEVCSKVITQPTPSLLEMRDGVPIDLDAVVRKCLQKDREQRYSNIAELASALGPFAPRRARPTVERICSIVYAAELSQSGSTVSSASERNNPSATADTMSPPLSQTAPGKSRSRAIPVFVSLGVLVIALLVGTVVLRSPAPRPATSVAPLAHSELSAADQLSSASSAMASSTISDTSVPAPASAIASVMTLPITISNDLAPKRTAETKPTRGAARAVSPASTASANVTIPPQSVATIVQSSAPMNPAATVGTATSRSSLPLSQAASPAATPTRPSATPTPVTNPKSKWGGRL